MPAKISHSRMRCAKTCLKKYWYQYVAGIERGSKHAALRKGVGLHRGLELLANGEKWESVCLGAVEHYEDRPRDVEPRDWEAEREQVLRLLYAYAWRWQNDQLEYVETEFEFTLPILNERGKRTATKVGGFIDGIVRLPDGRLAVKETKTTDDDISDNADYWKRLTLDEQISLYVIAARRKGYEVETVLYDVVRKPTTKPKQVPQGEQRKRRKIDGVLVEITDEEREVLNYGTIEEIRLFGTYYGEETTEPEPDNQGKIWETAEMYGSRLQQELISNPQKYFQRMEIPRLEADLRTYERELEQTAKLLKHVEKTGSYIRNTSACLFPTRCEFFDLCCSDWQPYMGIPDGFKLRESAETT